MTDDGEEAECEECEKLKQLVFQAKEAIDDLKLEIEEWKDISANKDSELRQIQHKVFNDMQGIEKRVDFSDKVQKTAIDQDKPVNPDVNKHRNFVRFNKQKIRSRSVHKGEKNRHRVGSAKKGVLKR